MSSVSPIPAGYPAVCPNLVVANAPALIHFLSTAFDAVERVRNTNPDGSIAHAELLIRESVIFVSDAPRSDEATRSSLHLYDTDVDAVYERAIAAGATADGPPANQFWGDRTVNLFDPAGNRWWVSTHVEDLTEEEITRRAASL